MRLNADSMASRGQVGLLTMGFADPQPTPSQAAKCLAQIRRRLLPHLFAEWITVKERGERGKKLHFHLMVRFKENVGTPDFAAVEQGDYRTVSAHLKRIWSELRKRLPLYGFGAGHHLLPCKSSAAGIAFYVGGYMAKSWRWKKPEDYGTRTVAYSLDTGLIAKDGKKIKGNACGPVNSFAFSGGGRALWRQGLARFCAVVGEHNGQTAEAAAVALTAKSSRWQWTFRELIAALGAGLPEEECRVAMGYRRKVERHFQLKEARNYEEGQNK